MNSEIVVWDPAAKFWEGSIVDTHQANLIRSRKGVALPCDPDCFSACGGAGFVKRAWGSGWPLTNNTPRMVSPVTLFSFPRHRNLAWAARIVPDTARLESARAVGIDDTSRISISAVPSRGNTQQPGYSVREQAKCIRELGPCDEFDGWTIGGSGLVTVQSEGHHAYSLYGTGQGIRVLWLAVTTF